MISLGGMAGLLVSSVFLPMFQAPLDEQRVSGDRRKEMVLSRGDSYML